MTAHPRRTRFCAVVKMRLRENDGAKGRASLFQDGAFTAHGAKLTAGQMTGYFGPSRDENRACREHHAPE
jgi:hypothetical protein